MTDYTKQAEDFLARHGLAFRATPTDSGKCPLFCDGTRHVHGDEYRCTVARTRAAGERPAGRQLAINFWNSHRDMEEGKHPEAYDLLACLTKSDPGTFEEFCSEFGYDTDSRKAETTYKAVQREWQKASRFFTDAELEELREIQ